MTEPAQDVEIGDDVIVYFAGRPVSGRPLTVRTGWEGDQYVELPADFAVPAEPKLTPEAETVQSPAENESRQKIRTEIATKSFRSWLRVNRADVDYATAELPDNVDRSVWLHSADVAMEYLDASKVERDALSSMLRGMARQLVSGRREYNSLVVGLKGKQAATTAMADAAGDFPAGTSYSDIAEVIATTREKLHHLELIMGEVRELAELDGNPTDELVVHTLQERLADASTKLVALEHPERPPWTPVRPEDPWEPQEPDAIQLHRELLRTTQELATTREERRVLWHLLKLSTKRRWLETGAIMDAARRDWNLLNSVIEAKDELLGRSDGADVPSEPAAALARAADAPSELVSLPSNWKEQIHNNYEQGFAGGPEAIIELLEIHWRGTATQPTPEPTYFLAADVRNRFMEYVKDGLDFDSGIRKAWDRFEKVLTAFPANSHPPTPSELPTSPRLGVEEGTPCRCCKAAADMTGFKSGMCAGSPTAAWGCGHSYKQHFGESGSLRFPAPPSPEEKQATVWGDDDEVFCPRCAAGVDSSEHHTKCVVTGHAFDGEAAQDPRRPAGGTGDPQ